MSEMTILKELKKGLIAWYEFMDNARALYIGDEADAAADYLRAQSGEVYSSDGSITGKNLSLTVASIDRVADEAFAKRYKNTFDYVICIGVIETVPHPEDIIRALKFITADGAVLLFGMNNRMGIRYFCGDRDPYTERNFDGIEGYRRAYKTEEDEFRGRMYDKAEIRNMLLSCDAKCMKFYSVLSDIDNPVLLFAEGFTPKEDLATRLYPVYNYPESVFLEEEPLYKTLVDNDMFHQMANAYLVEFSFTDKCELSDALQITCTMIRNPQDAMFTILHEEYVEKRNVYPEGHTRLQNMIKYAEDLKSHGLKVIDMELTEDGIRMPLIEAPVGQLYLKNLFLTDMDAFLKTMDHFRDLILMSSETVGEDMGEDLGVTLKNGYVDLVPLNSFYMDGDFVFFDQEFREEQYPANAIIGRMVSTFYAGNFDLQSIMTRDELYGRYHLLERIGDWRRMEGRFLSELRNDGALRGYYNRVRRNGAIVNSNRQRMNYSADDYYRLFVDVFKNVDTRKLILFGSGKFASRFMEMYAPDYPVYAIIDNNETKWGEELGGVKIFSPEYLKELSPGEYKVLICIKNYTSVIKQLKDMGVAEFSVYDPAQKYPRKRHPVTDVSKTEIDGRKKYHTGYIAGVFDLFHVGHLNMFKRAKKLCDYLIVGVVSDEGAFKHNKKKTFVPFEERIEMVRSCRYVDEVVEIPLDLNDTKEALAMYHFDVQFSGSDYINNPRWIEKQKYLLEHGADLVFFPYTKSTNSTSIKALIEKGLLNDDEDYSLSN